MRTRDRDLRRLRPEIPVNTAAASPIETFQHETLRPILKLQNPLILSLVRSFLTKYHTNFSQLSVTEQEERLRNLLKQDRRLKRLLLGMVVGCFTTDEFAFFLEHEAEIRRRIVPLLIKRVQDQIDHLVVEA